MTPANNGLPEGVELIDFRPAGPNDFELIRSGGVDNPTTRIYKGMRPGASAGMRVQAGQGYTFVPTGEFEQVVDIKDLSVKPFRPIFECVKVIPEETIKITAEFKVSNQRDKDRVADALKALGDIPGFAGVS